MLYQERKKFTSIRIYKTRPSGQRCVLMDFWAYPLIEMREGNLSTAIATFAGRELLWCYSWLFRPSWTFRAFITKALQIYRRTDGQTDTPSYRDARTHLQRSYHLLMRYTTQELFFYSAKIILHRRRLGKELDTEWSKSIFSENSFGQSFFQLKFLSQKKQNTNLVEKDYWPKHSLKKI